MGDKKLKVSKMTEIGEKAPDKTKSNEGMTLVDTVPGVDQKVLSSIMIQIVQGEHNGQPSPLMQVTGPLEDEPLFMEMMGRALNTFSMNIIKLQGTKAMADISLINIPEIVDYLGKTLTSLGAHIRESRQGAFKYSHEKASSVNNVKGGDGEKSDLLDLKDMGLGLVAPPGAKIN